MNILLIGSGGREHALTWKIAQSPNLGTLFIAPGNPGTKSCGTNIKLNDKDHDAVVKFCVDNKIGLVVIGPEAPLVHGLADDLAKAGIPAFGPSAEAAKLEGSKGFTKDLCAEANIPTAAYQRFNNAPKAKAYIRTRNLPIVIKADGLAAGKGVTVATSFGDAFDAVDDCFEGAWGKAGAELVVEDFLSGTEASFFCLCDGKTALPFGTAQDHKRVGDGDTGPNTGGMGAFSPAANMDAALETTVMETIIHPTLKTMAARGTPFIGVLYAGLMITDKGPELIEYNVRFGDPECQVLMMRLISDIVPILHAAATGALENITADWSADPALTIVMAATGYPGTLQKGYPIKGLDEAGAVENTMVFHAGTAEKNGQIISNGGRVLNVTATASTLGEARDKAYQAAEKIDWPEGFYRKDIGASALKN